MRRKKLEGSGYEIEEANNASLHQCPGGSTPRILGWGCAVWFSRPWPCKYIIFHTLFQTWPPKSLPHFKPVSTLLPYTSHVILFQTVYYWVVLFQNIAPSYRIHQYTCVWIIIIIIIIIIINCVIIMIIFFLQVI